MEMGGNDWTAEASTTSKPTANSIEKSKRKRKSAEKKTKTGEVLDLDVKSGNTLKFEEDEVKQKESLEAMVSSVLPPGADEAMAGLTMSPNLVVRQVHTSEASTLDGNGISKRDNRILPFVPPDASEQLQTGSERASTSTASAPSAENIPIGASSTSSDKTQNSKKEHNSPPKRGLRRGGGQPPLPTLRTMAPTKKTYPKPDFSYTALVSLALKNSTSGGIPVSEVYKFICYHFPYFETVSMWRNSIRHELSRNTLFISTKTIERVGEKEKGRLWALASSKTYQMEAEVERLLDTNRWGLLKSMREPENLDLIKRGELKSDSSGSIEAEPVEVDDDPSSSAVASQESPSAESKLVRKEDVDEPPLRKPTIKASKTSLKSVPKVVIGVNRKKAKATQGTTTFRTTKTTRFTRHRGVSKAKAKSRRKPTKLETTNSTGRMVENPGFSWSYTEEDLLVIFSDGRFIMDRSHLGQGVEKLTIWRIQDQGGPMITLKSYEPHSKENSNRWFHISNWTGQQGSETRQWGGEEIQVKRNPRLLFLKYLPVCVDQICDSPEISVAKLYLEDRYFQHMANIYRAETCLKEPFYDLVRGIVYQGMDPTFLDKVINAQLNTVSLEAKRLRHGHAEISEVIQTACGDFLSCPRWSERVLALIVKYPKMLCIPLKRCTKGRHCDGCSHSVRPKRMANTTVTFDGFPYEKSNLMPHPSDHPACTEDDKSTPDFQLCPSCKRHLKGFHTLYHTKLDILTTIYFRLELILKEFPAEDVKLDSKSVKEALDADIEWYRRMLLDFLVNLSRVRMSTEQIFRQTNTQESRCED